MGLFQTSVLKKYIKLQDKKAVEKAYQKYSDYFLNLERQQNIIEIKEEGFQQKFLMELFVNVFEYVINPDPKYNLTTEFKNEKGGKKADGAILKDGKALAVIELKSTKTKDLESIRQQAFDYKVNHSACVYVITSNFEKIRFYINNAVEFEEFNLFTLNLDQFEFLYLYLHKDNILQNIPLKIKTDSVVAEEKITKTFYSDYSQFKRELFRDLVKQNLSNEIFRIELQKEDTDRATKNIKQALFKKSQKLIDRFLFIFFAEDKGLLPPNSTLQILHKWKADWDFGDERPLYDLFKQYFKFLDSGRKGTQSREEIFAYNGGLFKPDPILDSLILDDQTLFKHTKTLSDYDFESQVGVNILGHIFENSLNEIESVNAEIEGKDFDKQKTKRKKDGVFYTPKYITKYIVDNTIGKLCEEKKLKFNIKVEEYQKSRKGRKKETLKKLKTKLDNYRNWLLSLTILDPACGSGAFLNQALDFLIKEHTYIDELETSLFGGGMVFQNIENTILENNIYGVDINEESVEIAKLSLWLRTAQPRRKLNTLNDNIKCGNSLIDDPKIAGDKAFNWQNEFPQVFIEKEKKSHHITWVTHNSRTSQRMIEYKVKRGGALWLDNEWELNITTTIAEIIKKDNLNVLAYNICGDHVHLLLVCEDEEVPNIVRKLKGQSSQELKEYLQISKEEQFTLWAQKYSNTNIDTEEKLHNTIAYIQTNREKHNLPGHPNSNKGLQPLVEKPLIEKPLIEKPLVEKPLVEKPLVDGMCCSYQHAFRSERKGGFDVVIGNPPYVRSELLGDFKSIFQRNYVSFNGNADLYVYFYELGMHLLKDMGILAYIAPNKWIQSKYGENLRNLIGNKYQLLKFIDFGEANIFYGVGTFPSIAIIQKSDTEFCLEYSEMTDLTSIKNKDLNDLKIICISRDALKHKDWLLKSENISNLINKLETNLPRLGQLLNNKFLAGIKTGANKVLIFTKNQVDRITGDTNEKRLFKPIFFGKNINKYGINSSDQFVFFPYQFIDGKQEKINLDDFPKTLLYLNEYKLDLMKRAIIKEGVPKGTHLWYELQQINKVFDYNLPKIIYPDIAIDNRFAIDYTGSIPDMTCFFIPIDDISILAILNSRIFKFLAANYCPILGSINDGGRIRYKSNYMANIPFPNSNEIKLKDYSILRTELFHKIDDRKSSFLKYLFQSSSVESLTTKLQNWHELDFADFIKELNKAIKKANGEKLTKKEEMEWMELFEEKKAEAQALKAEIDKTDKEIDQMVYELYGLTEDEIKIIENE